MSTSSPRAVALAALAAAPVPSPPPPPPPPPPQLAEPLELAALDAVAAAATKSGARPPLASPRTCLRHLTPLLATTGDVHVAELAGIVRTLGALPVLPPSAPSPVGTPRGTGADARVSTGGGEEPPVRLLRLLGDHIKACEKGGKYVEAAAAQAAAVRVQHGLEAVKVAEMKARHEGQRSEAGAVHEAEAAAHNAAWDAKSGEYEALVAGQLDKLGAAAAAREAEAAADLGAKAPRRLQPSKELLEQRAKQEALGRLGQYAEAAAVQKAADRLEAAEAAASGETFCADTARTHAALVAKAGAEREALLLRANRGRDQLRIARAAELETLKQRYRNVLAALDSQHKREAVQLDYFLAQQALAGKRAAKGGVAGGASGGPGAFSAAAAAVSSPPKDTSPFGAGSKIPKSTAQPTGVAALRSAAARKGAGAAARTERAASK